MSSLSPVEPPYHSAQQSPIDAYTTATDAKDELSGQIVFKKVHVPLSYPPPPGALKLQSDIITVFPPPKSAEHYSSPTTVSPPATPSSQRGGSVPSTPSSTTARRSFEALEQQHLNGGSIPSVQRNNTATSMTTQEGTGPRGATSVPVGIPVRRRSSGRTACPAGRMSSMPNLYSSKPGQLSSSVPNLPVWPTPMEEQEQGENCRQRDGISAGNVSALLPAPASLVSSARLFDPAAQDHCTSLSSINTLQLHHHHDHLTDNAETATTTATHGHTQQLPSPPESPWIKTRRPSIHSKLNRAATMFVTSTSAITASNPGHHDLVESDIPYPDLPTNVRSWTSTHVATYLCHILRFYPRAITEDLARYVRQTACLSGEEFLDIQDDDLARMGINQKWRQLIMEGVRALRRETLRMTRSLDGMRWEDGFDPLKDSIRPPSALADGHVTEDEQLSEPMACPEQRYSYHDLADHQDQVHSRVASYHAHGEADQDDDSGNVSDDADEVDLDQFQKELEYRRYDPPHRDSYHHDHDGDSDLRFGHRLQGLKKSFMSSVTSLTNMFPDQQQSGSTGTVIECEEATLLERMGFVEGVVVGGIAVACLLRLVR